MIIIKYYMYYIKFFFVFLLYVKYYNLAVHMRTLIQFRGILDEGEIESVHRVVKAIKTAETILINPQPHHLPLYR